MPNDPVKPKVLIVNDGVDLSVPELKEAGVKNINKLSGEVASIHGTSVTGVYVRTLKRLLETYYGKEIDLKDYVSMGFLHDGRTGYGSIYSYQSWPRNDEHKDAFHKSEVYNVIILDDYYSRRFNNVTIENFDDYHSVNMSINSFYPAEYNLVLPQTDNQDYLNIAFRLATRENTFIVAGAGDTPILTSNDYWFTNSPYACVVGAYYIDNTIKSDNETTLLKKSGYCRPSASIWFSAPGYHLTYNTVSTRDYYGDDGYPYLLETKTPDANRNVPARKKKIYISGTAFAASYTLAIKDFLKIVRPKLDDRNIERLLLMATEKLDTKKLRSWWRGGIDKIVRKPYQNAVRSWNNERKTYYFEYGFGGLGEDKVVHLAKIWKKQLVEELKLELKPIKYVQEQGVHTYYYDCADDYQVFNVQAQFKSSHLRKELSELSIESPSGTKSYIYTSDYSPKVFYQMFKNMPDYMLMYTGNSAYGVSQYCQQPINNRVMSMHANGEKTKGPWVLRSNVKLELDQQKIVIRANTWLVDDLYLFDNGILDVAKPAPLVDTDKKGKNTIDLSLYTKGKTIVDFKKRSISFMVSGKVKKIVPIEEGTFQTVRHSQLGTTIINKN